MKHADFQIGLEFYASGGFRWRCTDVGTRTILAIRLDRTDPNWYQGPPYIAEEVVFDEAEIECCFLTETEALLTAARELETGGHPGYPGEALFKMLASEGANAYPHEGVLRFDRRRSDGEILHPYAGRQAGDGWMVELYLPFLEVFTEMPEEEFIALPRVTDDDFHSRKVQ